MATTSAYRLAGILVLLATLVCRGPAAWAQDLASEQALRAAMVFNFLKFTEFPAETPGNPARLRLCIAVGDPQQAEALYALVGRKVGGRELVVVRLAGQEDDCHVFYVDSPQRWNAAADSRALRRALTLSAYAGFAQDGGMIEIALQAEGARFDINLGKSRRAGLRFAPQLLRLARRVHE